MRFLLALIVVVSVLADDAQAGIFSRLRARRAGASSCATSTATAPAATSDCSTATVAPPPPTIVYLGQTYQLVPVTSVKK